MHGYKCSRTYEYIMCLEKQKAFFFFVMVILAISVAIGF